MLHINPHTSCMQMYYPFKDDYPLSLNDSDNYQFDAGTAWNAYMSYVFEHIISEMIAMNETSSLPLFVHACMHT